MLTLFNLNNSINILIVYIIDFITSVLIISINNKYLNILFVYMNFILKILL